MLVGVSEDRGRARALQRVRGKGFSRVNADGVSLLPSSRIRCSTCLGLCIWLNASPALRASCPLRSAMRDLRLLCSLCAPRWTSQEAEAAFKRAKLLGPKEAQAYANMAVFCHNTHRCVRRALQQPARPLA